MNQAYQNNNGQAFMNFPTINQNYNTIQQPIINFYVQAEPQQYNQRISPGQFVADKLQSFSTMPLIIKSLTNQGQHRQRNQNKSRKQSVMIPRSSKLTKAKRQKTPIMQMRNLKLDSDQSSNFNSDKQTIKTCKFQNMRQNGLFSPLSNQFKHNNFDKLNQEIMQCQEAQHLARRREKEVKFKKTWDSIKSAQRKQYPEQYQMKQGIRSTTPSNQRFQNQRLNEDSSAQFQLDQLSITKTNKNSNKQYDRPAQIPYTHQFRRSYKDNLKHLVIKQMPKHPNTQFVRTQLMNRHSSKSYKLGSPEMDQTLQSLSGYSISHSGSPSRRNSIYSNRTIKQQKQIPEDIQLVNSYLNESKFLNIPLGQNQLKAHRLNQKRAISAAHTKEANIRKNLIRLKSQQESKHKSPTNYQSNQSIDQKLDKKFSTETKHKIQKDSKLTKIDIQMRNEQDNCISQPKRIPAFAQNLQENQRSSRKDKISKMDQVADQQQNAEQIDNMDCCKDEDVSNQQSEQKGISQSMSDFNELNLKIQVNNLEDVHATNSQLKKQDSSHHSTQSHNQTPQLVSKDSQQDSQQEPITNTNQEKQQTNQTQRNSLDSSEQFTIQSENHYSSLIRKASLDHLNREIEGVKQKAKCVSNVQTTKDIGKFATQLSKLLDCEIIFGEQQKTVQFQNEIEWQVQAGSEQEMFRDFELQDRQNHCFKIGDQFEKQFDRNVHKFNKNQKRQELNYIITPKVQQIYDMIYFDQTNQQQSITFYKKQDLMNIKRILTINDIDIQRVKYYRIVRKQSIQDRIESSKNASIKKRTFFREKTGHFLKSTSSMFIKRYSISTKKNNLSDKFNILDAFVLIEAEEDLKRKLKCKGKQTMKINYFDERTVMKQFTKIQVFSEMKLTQLSTLQSFIEIEDPSILDQNFSDEADKKYKSINPSAKYLQQVGIKSVLVLFRNYEIEQFFDNEQIEKDIDNFEKKFSNLQADMDFINTVDHLIRNNLNLKRDHTYVNVIQLVAEKLRTQQLLILITESIFPGIHLKNKYESKISLNKNQRLLRQQYFEKYWDQYPVEQRLSALYFTQLKSPLQIKSQNFVNHQYFLNSRFDYNTNIILNNKKNQENPEIARKKTDNLQIPHLFKLTFTGQLVNDLNQNSFYQILFREKADSIYYNLYDQDLDFQVRFTILRILKNEKRSLFQRVKKISNLKINQLDSNQQELVEFIRKYGYRFFGYNFQQQSDKDIQKVKSEQLFDIQVAMINQAELVQKNKLVDTLQQEIDDIDSIQGIDQVQMQQNFGFKIDFSQQSSEQFGFDSQNDSKTCISQNYQFKRQNAMNKYFDEICEFTVLKAIGKQNIKVKDRVSLFYKRVDQLIDKNDKVYGRLSKDIFGYKCQLIRLHNFCQVMEIYTPCQIEKTNDKLENNSISNFVPSSFQQFLKNEINKQQIDQGQKISNFYKKLKVDEFETDDSMRQVNLNDIQSDSSMDELYQEDSMMNSSGMLQSNLNTSKKQKKYKNKKSKALKKLQVELSTDNFQKIPQSLLNEVANHKTPLDHYKQLKAKQMIVSINEKWKPQAKLDANTEADELLKRISFEQQKKAKLFKVVDHEIQAHSDDKMIRNFYKQMQSKVKIEGLIILTQKMVINDNQTQIMHLMKKENQIEKDAENIGAQLSQLKADTKMIRDASSSSSFGTDESFSQSSQLLNQPSKANKFKDLSLKKQQIVNTIQRIKKNCKDFKLVRGSSNTITNSLISGRISKKLSEISQQECIEFDQINNIFNNNLLQNSSRKKIKNRYHARNSRQKIISKIKKDKINQKQLQSEQKQSYGSFTKKQQFSQDQQKVNRLEKSIDVQKNQLKRSKLSVKFQKEQDEYDQQINQQKIELINQKDKFKQKPVSLPAGILKKKIQENTESVIDTNEQQTDLKNQVNIKKFLSGSRLSHTLSSQKQKDFLAQQQIISDQKRKSLSASKDLLSSSSLFNSKSIKNFDAKIEKGEMMYPEVAEESDFDVENELKILKMIQSKENEIKDVLRQKNLSSHANNNGDQANNIILPKIKKEKLQKIINDDNSQYYRQYKLKKDQNIYNQLKKLVPKQVNMKN